MAKTYRGAAGGSKPENKPGSGFKVKGYRLYEPAQNQEGEIFQKKIVDFSLKSGEKKRPVVVLDTDLDYAVRMHKGFKHDGTWSNMIVCRSALEDTRGCPLCDVLERRYSWFLVGTLIDMGTWSPETGKNAGKIYRNFRRLLLIPDSVSETFEEQGEDLDGGWRGARFKVSRSTKDKSYRIGDSWVYDHRAGHMTEQEMMDEFEEQAGTYMLPAERFCQPFDYDTLLKPKSYEELLQIAEAISGGTVTASAPSTLAPLAAAGGDGEDECLPF